MEPPDNTGRAVRVQVRGYESLGTLRYKGPLLRPGGGVDGAGDAGAIVCGVELDVYPSGGASHEARPLELDLGRYFRAPSNRCVLVVPADCRRAAQFHELAAGKTDAFNAATNTDDGAAGRVVLGFMPAGVISLLPGQTRRQQNAIAALVVLGGMLLMAAFIAFVAVLVWLAVAKNGSLHALWPGLFNGAGYTQQPSHPEETVRLGGVPTGHASAVWAALQSTPPLQPSEIGWVINNFSPRIGINAKGGTTIFPEVFGELGWRKLLMTGSEGTGGFRLTVPPGGLVEFSRGGALPHAYLASYLGTLAVVLAVAVALRARRSNRVSATASVTERARLRWRELRASERLAALAAGLLGLYGMAAIWPTTWFKPAATSVTTLGWSDLALAGSPPLRMAMILNSPSYNMLYKYRHWQSDVGPGCTGVNHLKQEWRNFNKLAFLGRVRDWADEVGCDASVVIPPTYFMHSRGTDWGDAGDCVSLFGAQNQADNETVWFQKDPKKDGFGMGVSVHTIDTLAEHWKMPAGGPESALAGPGGGEVKSRCAALAKEMRAEGKTMLIQKGVDPLLLSGSRKFDIRLYVLIADRAPYTAYLHWAYMRFSDKVSTKGGGATLDRSQHIANVFVANPRHTLLQHWIPQRGLAELLASPEARPVLDALGISDPVKAAELAHRNTLGAVTAAFSAMRAEAGTERGGFVLTGVDVLLDDRLRGYVLETNSDPEFGNDVVRNNISRAVGKGMFSLVAEQRMKTAPLFTGHALGTHADPRGKCFGSTFAPVPQDSPAGRSILETEIPGFTLLISEAVEPPYSYLDTLPKSTAGTNAGGRQKCFNPE